MIYLDHASTTYVYPEVIEAINEALKNNWGNPSNIYKFGQESKRHIEQARSKIANVLKCKPNEIYFTGGASEGNAWAISQRSRCISSVYEHHNITENDNVILADEDYIDRIEQMNYTQQSYLKNIYKKDYVYSHMLVSNETGEIFDVKKLFKFPKEYGMFTHCDMTQALCNFNINLSDPTYENIDMATFSGHKVHAPKGVGFAFIRENVEHIKPLLYGGIQEKGIRAGTENIPYIVGLGIAVEKAYKNAYDKHIWCAKLKDAAKAELIKTGVPHIINEGENNLTSTLNFALPNVEGEVIQALLSDEEIYIGTGSACGDGTMEVSKTLKQMGVPEDYIHGAIRLTFDLTTTEEEIKTAINKIVDVYKGLVK